MTWLNWSLLTLSVAALLFCWGMAVNAIRRRYDAAAVAVMFVAGAINLPFIFYRLSIMGII